MPDDFEASTSTLGTIDEAGFAFGTIEEIGDQDWFRVELVAGQRYAIDLMSDFSNDFGLRDPLFVGVYDNLGNFQGYGNDDAGSDTLDSFSYYTALYSGTHYLSAAAFVGEGTNLGDYSLEISPFSQGLSPIEEVLNEGNDLNLSISAEIPSDIQLPFPGTGSPDELIAARDISLQVISADAVEGEDFTVSYSFGQTQSLNFAALEDALVEDDETVLVRVSGYVDWIIPFDSSDSSYTNLLGEFVSGTIQRTYVDLSLEVTINSAPEGEPFPIEAYTFTGPEIIGNVLTEFEDGSLETFTAVPFSFESPTIQGELLENGDISITGATGITGERAILRFDVVDERGAVTQSEQIIEFGGGDDYLPGRFAEILGTALVDVPTTGNIEIQGDRDRFEVALQAGVEYEISLEGLPTNGGLNPDPEIVGVFASSGALIPGGADDNGGTGTNALVSGLIVPTDGIYQIEVAGADDVNIGDYTLSVDFVRYLDDYLPGISGDFGSVSIDGSSTGEIETAGDIDGFRAFFQTGTTYRIDVRGQDSNGGTLADPDIRGIFASGAPANFVQTFDDGGVGRDGLAYFTPTSSGDYFIEVAGFDDETGTYTVSINDLGLRDDYASDISTDGTVAPNASTTGRIDFSSDADWFEANLLAGRLYQIELVPETGGDVLADPFFNGVYDSTGQLIENTSSDDGGFGTSSSIQFVTDDSGVYYLSAGGFSETTGQYRLVLSDQGALDDGGFDITLRYSSDDYPSAYIDAFETAVERWEEVITGDLFYAFVNGFGYVDDILIDVTFDDIDLEYEGVSQTIIAISSVLDQRPADAAIGGLLPTHSRVVLNTEEADRVRLNLDELAANTIGRALGFGSLWEDFGLVQQIEGTAVYTGLNVLRELDELSGNLNRANILEDGSDGALAAEYWDEGIFDAELMTPRIEFRGAGSPPRPPNIPDNPLSSLTIAAMQDLGYTVNFDAADSFNITLTAIAQSSADDDDGGSVEPQTQEASAVRLASELPDSDEIPSGAVYIYRRPNILSEQLGSFALSDNNSELLLASGTNALFVEGVTGENLTVELKGTFDKNAPTSVDQLSGTVTSMEVSSLSGTLLFSIDFSQKPIDVSGVIAQWPGFPINGENVIVVDTLPGTVARVNPNGGNETESRIFAGAGDDFVRGGDLDELINGGADNDTLLGENGNDTLLGENGLDVLEGGRGNDLINGGNNADTAVYSGNQSSYTVQLSPTETIITDRRSSEDGTDRLVSVETLAFADGSFELDIRSGAVGLSADDFAAISELYIAYFDRAPASIGLLYWATRLAEGMSLPEIAQSFFGQPETQRTYETYLKADGSLNDTAAFVTAVFNNVLGRDPSSAYWINELDNNPAITPAIFILSVLNGARAETGGAGDVAYLQDKTDIGVYFSAIRGLSEFEDTVSVIELYDGSSASVNNAVSAIDQIYAEALDPNNGEFLMPLVGVINDPFAVA